MHRKRHALGQNFLTDTRVIDAIVQYTLEQLKRHPIECLLEIGPGKGALTFPLVEKLPSDLLFSCIEVDAHLVDRLIDKRPSLKVYHQDARHVPDIFLKKKMGVVSNLPYASGVHILLQWSQHPCLLFFVVMLQKEVAQKILAPMGTSKASSLSVWLQNWFEVRSLLKVLPLSFSPSPKVHSEVILLTRRAQPCMPVENIQKWEQCLKKLFFAPRKMLRSKWVDKARYPLLNTKRASDLSWEEHAELFCAFQNSPSFFL